MSGPVSLEAARRDLSVALADLRSALARVRVRVVPTRAEQEEFERQALSGALGPGASELARRLRGGATTWADVLQGTTPDADLLREHVHRMVETYGASVRRQLSHPDVPQKESRDPV